MYYTKAQALQIKANLKKEGVKQSVVAFGQGQYRVVSPATASAYKKQGLTIVTK